jgi:hypothetical protein
MRNLRDMRTPLPNAHDKISNGRKVKFRRTGSILDRLLLA